MPKIKSYTWFKWTHWEYWPWWVFYAPVMVYYAWLVIKSGTINIVAYVNPGMYGGGFANDSKYNVLKQLPLSHIPKTVLIPVGTSVMQVEKIRIASGIDYPCVIKPDRGERGRMVEKIQTFKELEEYMKDVQEPLLLQYFSDLPREYGVFFVRMPWEKQGRVTSVMERKFLSVVGDGVSTLEDLIIQHVRAKLYMQNLLQKYKKELSVVLPKGEEKKLVVIGNHCRGTEFRNVTKEIVTPEMNAAYTVLTAKVKNVWYGRYDIKVSSIDDVRAGKGHILELNGAKSEPAHIYHPGYSLLQAYKDVLWHWGQLYKIAIYNKKQGHKAESVREIFMKHEEPSV